MNEAFFHDDATVFIPLHQRTVVVPQNMCAVVQVGGCALKREAIALEDNLP